MSSRAGSAVAPSPSPPVMPIGATACTSLDSGEKRTVAVSRSKDQVPCPGTSTTVPSWVTVKSSPEARGSRVRVAGSTYCWPSPTEKTMSSP